MSIERLREACTDAGLTPEKVWHPQQAIFWKRVNDLLWQRLSNDGQGEIVEDSPVAWTRGFIAEYQAVQRTFWQRMRKTEIDDAISTPDGTEVTPKGKKSPGYLLWGTTKDVSVEAEATKRLLPDASVDMIGPSLAFIRDAIPQQLMPTRETRVRPGMTPATVSQLNEEDRPHIEQTEQSFASFLALIRERAGFLSPHVLPRLEAIAQLIEHNRLNNPMRSYRAFMQHIQHEQTQRATPVQMPDFRFIYYDFTPGTDDDFASFSSVLRSMRIPSALQPDNLFSNSIYLHEAGHALQDVEARMRPGAQQYYQLQCAGDGMVIPFEFESWGIQCEVLNAVLNDGIRNGCLSIEEMHTALHVSPSEETLFRNVIQGAQIYFQDGDRIGTYPRRFLHSLYNSYRSSRNVWVPSKGGYAPCSSFEDAVRSL